MKRPHKLRLVIKIRIHIFILSVWHDVSIFSIDFSCIDELRGGLGMEVLKVSSKSNPNSVAGALANTFRERGIVEIQAIGAGALNQAVKAIAIARGYVAPTGKDLICVPAFTDIYIDGFERTAIKLIVEARG